jgi:hypothetical protein
MPTPLDRRIERLREELAQANPRLPVTLDLEQALSLLLAAKRRIEHVHQAASAPFQTISERAQ